MTRHILIRGLMALGLASLAAAARADNLFDGAGKAVLPSPDFTAVRAAAAASSAAPRIPYTRQSGRDLFYFTREEAALALKRFGARPRDPRVSGDIFDSDVPESVKTQMIADLKFIGGIRGGRATPLHRKIFGAVDGPAYAQFFESRVTGIGMDSCGGGKAVACVIPFYDPSKMWLTQNFVKFSHPQVSRMMIVFHEARHTETRNGNWSHATCPDPFKDADGDDMKSIWTGALLAGEPACDGTPLGSYGSSTVMLKNISKFCSNCTDKVKMDAGLYADDQLGRIIDPAARREMQDDFER